MILDDSIYMVTPLKMAVIVELYTEATIRKRRLPSRHRGRTPGRDSVVRRTLLRSTAFIRAAKRLVKRHPASAKAIRETLDLLSADAFQPALKTHKLKGDLEDAWACSVGYDLRIVFELIEHQSSQAMLLLSVGTHDEVY